MRSRTEPKLPRRMAWRLMIAEEDLDQVQPGARGRGEVQRDPRVAAPARPGPRGACGWRSCRITRCSFAPRVGLRDLLEERAGTPGGGAGRSRRRSPCRWRPPARRTAWWCRAGRSRGSAFSGSPGRSGRIGAVRSSAWIWDFSSTHSTTAFSGGSRYSPTTSRTLASSSGSVENLNVSARHGCRPHLRQILATVTLLIPSSAGQQPRRPVRHPEPVRRRLQRRRHDRGLIDHPRPPGLRPILQAADALGRVPALPRRSPSACDTPTRATISFVPHPVRGQQHDPRPLRQPRPHRRRPRPRRQHLTIPRRHLHRHSQRHAP